jgi:AcrR family transcriptional regulator
VTSPNVDDGPRSAVIAAGQRLLGASGHGFTVDELVQEAGVALQTFYRYFGGKDQLLVALIGAQISEHCERLRLASAQDQDPATRLRRHLELTLTPLPAVELAPARFIAAAHWRLHQLVPEQLAAATQPFTDLIRAELELGQAMGALAPRHPSLDAWLITRTVMSVVHHFAFSPAEWSPVLATEVADHCIAAVGGGAGTADRGPTSRRATRARGNRSAVAPEA